MRRDTVRALLLVAWAAGLGATVSAATPPPVVDEYVFVPDTDREVGIKRGNRLLVGKLDADGNFLEKEREREWLDWTRSSAFFGEIINNYALNPAGQPVPRPVYEYRSGRLIKGVIDLNHNFVPEAGSAVIPFQDYRYSSKAIKIWNLPGRFVRKDEAGRK
jgi:hypothetical protein